MKKAPIKSIKKTTLTLMRSLILLTYFTLLMSCNQQTISYKEISQRTEASQDMAKKFGKTLKGKLQAAMKSGGPIAAISVCNQQAPLIAAELSKQSGWEIYRTSLKPRARKPDAWDKRMMKSFEQRHEDGDKFKSLFNQDISEVDGIASFRFIQAIETQKICLVCHGDNIAPAIADKITELYPNDKAIGFKEGDIRGAFSIIQPIIK